MDRAIVELLAPRAGLDKALAEFPEDVAAAEQASGSVAGMTLVDGFEDYPRRCYRRARHQPG
jgi:hypothetical protein